MRLRDEEAVYIWRRRRKISQAQAAREHGISLGEWKRMEAGRGIRKPMPVLPVATVNPGECCALERRRRSMSQGAVAEILGVTRQYVNMMERGAASAGTLVRFWRNFH